MDIHGDVLELSRRGWVILNVLCLESPDSCDPLTDFHYKGHRNIFFKVLGALRSKSSALSTMSQSMGIPESQCFSVWTSKLSHMPLALLAHERTSSPAPRVWSKGIQASMVAHLPPTGTILPFRFWTGLSPEILVIVKLKPFWMGIRMVLRLRCKGNAGRFSVKFSFGLKIWNSFAPLTHPQMPREASTWIHNARMPLSSVLLFLIVQQASYSFSLRGYTIAVLGKSFSELWFPHL